MQVGGGGGVGVGVSVVVLVMIFRYVLIIVLIQSKSDDLYPAAVLLTVTTTPPVWTSRCRPTCVGPPNAWPVRRVKTSPFERNETPG